jgi:hypothetical protein
MHILITMAGLGSRFRAKGYQIPKYQIGVHGRTLFAWSMESLRHFFPDNQATFVVRKEDQPEGFIKDELKAFGVEDPEIITLDQVTDGQATTVLMALPSLRARDPRASLLIYNIDTFVEPRALRPVDVRGDGWVPCFPGKGDAWSFFRGDAAGKVLEAKEKVRISDHASIGLYYFSSLDLYEDTYRIFFRGGLPEGLRERYVAPMYQELIDQGREVWIHQVPEDAVHPLGTPEEVERFQDR